MNNDYDKCVCEAGHAEIYMHICVVNVFSFQLAADGLLCMSV